MLNGKSSLLFGGKGREIVKSLLWFGGGEDVWSPLVGKAKEKCQAMNGLDGNIVATWQMTSGEDLNLVAVVHAKLARD
ncbi:hypothetical protein SLE2022_092410 [Rubroshorea leprosula]